MWPSCRRLRVIRRALVAAQPRGIDIPSLRQARLTASADVNLGAVGIYRGTPGALTQLACGLGDPLFATRAVAAANAAAGTTYYIGVSGSADTPSGTIFTTISAGPSNDDFDAAAPIGAVPFSTATDLRGATGAFDDPGCGGGGAFGGANLWCMSTMQLMHEGSRRQPALSGFDVELGVFTGARGSLTQQGAVAQALSSSLAWRNLLYRRRHQLLLDFIADARMTVGLNAALPTPAHDNFDQRRAITSLPFSETLDNRLATTAADDPACFARANTYWYAYKPTANERVFAKVLSGTGSVLGVYTGTRGRLKTISCTDEPFNPEFVFLNLKRGTTYYFMVASAADRGSIGQLIF